MKVALVHDYLKEYGGGERVLEVLHRMFPEAPVYTSFISRQGLGSAADRFEGWDLRTTWAQQVPGIAERHHTLRFLIPYFWEPLDLSGYDLVISCSSGYLGRAVITRPETLHIDYCHSPPRYLWGYRDRKQPTWYRRAYEHWADTNLRRYDFIASQRVDHFVANSRTVAARIEKFYRRPAHVIPPPVNVHGQGEAGGDYYLYVGRLAPRKQVHLAIAACERLGRALHIVGAGPEEEQLRQMAGPNTRFRGFLLPEDPAMDAIYAGARALLFPCAHEDFGIVPIEAMGRGVPVIALAQGGVRDSIIDRETGLLFSESSVDGLCTAIESFEQINFSSRRCIERARDFSEAVFVQRLRHFIEQRRHQHFLDIEAPPCLSRS